MTRNVLIGIDAGTSKVKTTLFSLDGTPLRELSADVALLTPAHDQAEIDVTRLLHDLIQKLKELVTGYEKNILSIGFSVTSPTLVLLDKDLDAIRPATVYLDNRSGGLVEQYTARLGGSEVFFRKVGNNPSPSTCVAATINWFKKHEPENWRKVFKLGFLNTYLAAQFTGSLAADPTVSSYSGLMNIAAPDTWDNELVDFFGIPSDLLPPVHWASHKVGELNRKMADALGIDTGIPVALGGADSAATCFALGILKHGEVMQSMGTSEVLTFCHSTPDFSPAYMNRTHVLRGLWLSHGAMSTTGAAINWLLSNVFPELSSEESLEREALLSPLGAGGLFFLPYLCGERSPIFDAKAAGTFFGVNLTTRRPEIIRAVYEGAAYGMRQIYKIGTDTWHVKPDYIRCVGGASKSPLAVQLRADALNTEFRSIEADTAASYGAAMLGGLAAGVFDGLDGLPYLTACNKTVKPTPGGVAHYEKHSEIYNRLYPVLKDLMHLACDYR